jgi:hypothetical protein
MRGTIFRVMGLAAGAMLLVGLGISANASVHQFRSVGSTGIHHEATGERHETPEPSEKPEATSKPKPTEKPDKDVETADETGAAEDSKGGSQNEDKSGDTKKDKGGSGGGSGGGD